MRAALGVPREQEVLMEARRAERRMLRLVVVDSGGLKRVLQLPAPHLVQVHVQ